MNDKLTEIKYSILNILNKPKWILRSLLMRYTTKYVFASHIRENDIIIGFVATNGKIVEYGKQYHWLYMTGRII